VDESWEDIVEREIGRYHDGEARLPAEADPRQRQLTRMGNAANGAGLALLMLGRDEEASKWLHHAAARWRESFGDAPPGSWGRPIGAIKALLLAGDRAGAADAARWALDAGAGAAESPIGRYAAALAHLVLEQDDEARAVATSIRGRDDFPGDVADALAALAAGDGNGYAAAVGSVLESFRERREYLEDVPIADTVMVLQTLAEPRDLAVELISPLLPTGYSPSV
jgi:hypothetical protein